MSFGRVRKRTRNPFTRRTKIKYTDMFTRRLVIVIPRSGMAILIIAVAINAAVPAVWDKWFGIVGIVTSIIAIASIAEARHQLRVFRYEAPERINAMLESYEIPDDLEDLRESEHAKETEIEATIIRLPKSG